MRYGLVGDLCSWKYNDEWTGGTVEYRRAWPGLTHQRQKAVFTA
jgi:hypothetical protein